MRRDDERVFWSQVIGLYSGSQREVDLSITEKLETCASYGQNRRRHQARYYPYYSEQFAMQLINRFQQAFQKEKVDCVVFPYEVISLAPDSGII
jgi:hypothetical protein